MSKNKMQLILAIENLIVTLLLGIVISVILVKYEVFAVILCVCIGAISGNEMTVIAHSSEEELKKRMQHIFIIPKKYRK